MSSSEDSNLIDLISINEQDDASRMEDDSMSMSDCDYYSCDEGGELMEDETSKVSSKAKRHNITPDTSSNKYWGDGLLLGAGKKIAKTLFGGKEGAASLVETTPKILPSQTAPADRKKRKNKKLRGTKEMINAATHPAPQQVGKTPKNINGRGWCKVEGCMKFTQSGNNGMCRKHYVDMCCKSFESKKADSESGSSPQRESSAATTAHPAPQQDKQTTKNIERGRCKVEGCEKLTQSGNNCMCLIHYREMCCKDFEFKKVGSESGRSPPRESSAATGKQHSIDVPDQITPAPGCNPAAVSTPGGSSPEVVDLTHDMDDAKGGRDVGRHVQPEKEDDYIVVPSIGINSANMSAAASCSELEPESDSKGSCFICGSGGNLASCSSCGRAFHSQCQDVPIWLTECKDCLSQRLGPPGALTTGAKGPEDATGSGKLKTPREVVLAAEKGTASQSQPSNEEAQTSLNKTSASSDTGERPTRSATSKKSAKSNEAHTQNGIPILIHTRARSACSAIQSDVLDLTLDETGPGEDEDTSIAAEKNELSLTSADLSDEGSLASSCGKAGEATIGQLKSPPEAVLVATKGSISQNQQGNDQATDGERSRSEDDGVVQGEEEADDALDITSDGDDNASVVLLSTRPRYPWRDRNNKKDGASDDFSEEESQALAQKKRVKQGANTKLFKGEHDDNCYMCEDGGDLVCCDYCEKVYHLGCHLPRLGAVPEGHWKCQECLAPELSRMFKCGDCPACLQEECGTCKFCRDKTKNGGPGKLKRPCELKRCPNKRLAPPETMHTHLDHVGEIQSEGFAPNESASVSTDQAAKKSGRSKRKHKVAKKNKSNSTKRRKKQSHRKININLGSNPFRGNGLHHDDCDAGCMKVTEMTMGKKPKKAGNFFTEIFGDRVLSVKAKMADTHQRYYDHSDNRRYELVSSKATERKGFYEVSEMKLVYVATEGEGLPTINVQSELNKLAGFSALSPIKARARLEHLQSEVKDIFWIKDPADKIELIDERGNEGCGFFPPSFFDGTGRKKEYDSVQVRIIGDGVWKGMLLKKEGITRLQIPNSMIKAPKGTGSDEVAVVFNNVFPSEPNSKLARFLDTELKPPSPGYIKEDQVKLSLMYQRMFLGYGVPEHVVLAYVKRAIKVDGMMHTHLIGVADPTLRIPEGMVFISGWTNDSNNKRVLFGSVFSEVYVSRSPAVAPEDAKLLSVLGEKPNGMSDGDWNMLCSYKWGTIIFGTPRRSSPPLPCIIADGDLDGDAYFICWDKQIISHFVNGKDELMTKSRKLLRTLKLPDKEEHSLDKTNTFSEGGGDWLALAQDKMLNFSSVQLASCLTGKLYNLCKAYSDIYDEDACAYARAYKDAMDIQKHGGKVYLPEHLHNNVKAANEVSPKKFKPLLFS